MTISKTNPNECDVIDFNQAKKKHHPQNKVLQLVSDNLELPPPTISNVYLNPLKETLSNLQHIFGKSISIEQVLVLIYIYQNPQTTISAIAQEHGFSHRDVVFFTASMETNSPSPLIFIQQSDIPFVERKIQLTEYGEQIVKSIDCNSDLTQN